MLWLVIAVVFVEVARGNDLACYSCTGRGKDACATLSNRHIENCHQGAYGCGMAVGIFPRDSAVTVERVCVYVTPQEYCQNTKRLLGATTEQEYFCRFCVDSLCNGFKLNSVVNELTRTVVTMNSNGKPIKTDCSD